MMVTRRAFATTLSLAGLAALVAYAPLPSIGDAMAQNATAAEPVSLPDMALGPKGAPVTIIEYSSMTCSHCATFGETVFPRIKSKYIDTGNVRFVFREFPLDNKALAASMLARCIANDDAGKYFGAVDTLLKQQDQLVAHTTDTLKLIGAQAGMSEQAIDTCLKDQALFDKLVVDQKIAHEIVKVNAVPTLFINGEKTEGTKSFEELDGKIWSLLRK
jgi:protein-disulfide isomerase